MSGCLSFPLAQALAQMLCESSVLVSGEALAVAFDKGGSAAEVAVAALLYYECPQGNTDAVLDAAFNAFTGQAALNKPDIAYRRVCLLLLLLLLLLYPRRVHRRAGVWHIRCACAQPLGCCHCCSSAIATAAATAAAGLRFAPSCIARPGGTQAPASHSPTYPPALRCRVAQNLVAAADAVGAGACVSIAVLDTAGELMDQVQVHTGASGGSDASASGGSDGESRDGSDGGEDGESSEGGEGDDSSGSSEGDESGEGGDGSEGGEGGEGGDYTTYSTRLLGGSREHSLRARHVPS